jgi:hypothetical protein
MENKTLEDKVRLAALKAVAETLEIFEDGEEPESLLLAHRILANNHPEGKFFGCVINCKPQ